MAGHISITAYKRVTQRNEEFYYVTQTNKLFKISI